MDKEKKNRSGSQSNPNGKNENMADRGRKELPGSRSAATGIQAEANVTNKMILHAGEKNTIKKGANNI